MQYSQSAADRNDSRLSNLYARERLGRMLGPQISQNITANLAVEKQSLKEK